MHSDAQDWPDQHTSKEAGAGAVGGVLQGPGAGGAAAGVIGGVTRAPRSAVLQSCARRRGPESS